MTARATARRLVLQATLVLPGAAGVSLLSPACYSGAGGTDPPTDTFYFPVGLAVSAGGNALYVVNSDFDLQWNGGTLQSYDLFRLRHDTAELIGANFLTPVPGDSSSLTSADGSRTVPSSLVAGRVNADIFATTNTGYLTWAPGCQNVPAATFQPNGSRYAFGEACSPAVDSTRYRRWSKIIGAFATDLQLSGDGTRLFAPVRGNATLTWADVAPDSLTWVPPGEVEGNDAGIAAPGATSWPVSTGNPPTPSQFDCGGPQVTGTWCDGEHQTGAVVTAADTRALTLPGEPFAMAQTPDGTAIVITHQTSPQTSVLLSGLSANTASPNSSLVPVVDPSMQFILSGVPVGGDGLAAVPHDPDSSVKPCELVGAQTPCVRPAFLETSHSAAELDLIRYYDDDGSSLHRPFLVREVAYTLAVNAGGVDSRGIVIDDTPRRACKFKLGPGADPSLVAQCAQLPARVFFASRSPPSLVLGEIGEPSASGDGTYDPDRLVIYGNVPLVAGPSRVYLAPVIDGSGRYALRVFITCFDSSQILVYDPDAGVVENVINVGPGPFAMAFDPFSLDDVAQRAMVPADPRQGDVNLKTETSIDVSSAGGGPASLKQFRFAYVTSFTYSYIQVIDLDDSVVEPCPGNQGQSCNVTFERPVFTLGQPTKPKGS
jgi:hypothetical protein